MKKIRVLTILVLAILCTLSVKGYCGNNTTGTAGDLIQEDAIASMPGLSVQDVKQRVGAAENLIENKNLINTVIDEAGNITITSDGDIDLSSLSISTTGSITTNSTIISSGSLTIVSWTEFTIQDFLPLEYGTLTLADAGSIVLGPLASGNIVINTNEPLTVNSPNATLMTGGNIDVGSTISVTGIQIPVSNITYGTIYASGSATVTSSASFVVISKAEAKSEEPKNIRKMQDEVQAKFVRDRVKKQREPLESLFDLKKDEIE